MVGTIVYVEKLATSISRGSQHLFGHGFKMTLHVDLIYAMSYGCSPNVPKRAQTSSNNGPRPAPPTSPDQLRQRPQTSSSNVPKTRSTNVPRPTPDRLHQHPQISSTSVPRPTRVVIIRASGYNFCALIVVPAGRAQDGPGGRLGGPRWTQEGPGGPRRTQEDQKKPKRTQEGSGGPRRTQESPEGPKTAQEGPGGPSRRQEGPTTTTKCVHNPRTYP